MQRFRGGRRPSGKTNDAAEAADAGAEEGAGGSSGVPGGEAVPGPSGAASTEGAGAGTPEKKKRGRKSSVWTDDLSAKFLAHSSLEVIVALDSIQMHGPLLSRPLDIFNSLFVTNLAHSQTARLHLTCNIRGNRGSGFPEKKMWRSTVTNGVLSALTSVAGITSGVL